MAASPQFKIYRGSEYVASCKYAEDAAAFVAIIGDTGTVRIGHTRVVWREGSEAESAGESYDHAAEVIWSRVRNRD